MAGKGPDEAVGTFSKVKVGELARVVGVEAGQVELEVSFNQIKGLVPKRGAIPKNSKKARLYALRTARDGGPSAKALAELGPFVAVPVAVRRAFEAGAVRVGDALMYVPGDEEGERVYHFRATRELVEFGERADPGEREVEVREYETDDWSADLRAAGWDEPAGDGTVRRGSGGSSSPRPGRRRRRAEGTGKA